MFLNFFMPFTTVVHFFNTLHFLDEKHVPRFLLFVLSIFLSFALSPWQKTFLLAISQEFSVSGFSCIHFYIIHFN